MFKGFSHIKVFVTVPQTDRPKLNTPEFNSKALKYVFYQSTKSMKINWCEWVNLKIFLIIQHHKVYVSTVKHNLSRDLISRKLPITMFTWLTWLSISFAYEIRNIATNVATTFTRTCRLLSIVVTSSKDVGNFGHRSNLTWSFEQVFLGFTNSGEPSLFVN